jgi:hypothetical protein
VLAFNAGAINAGGFLVLHLYTSHMTGFASQLLDGMARRNATLSLKGAGPHPGVHERRRRLRHPRQPVQVLIFTPRKVEIGGIQQPRSQVKQIANYLTLWAAGALA